MALRPPMEVVPIEEHGEQADGSSDQQVIESRESEPVIVIEERVQYRQQSERRDYPIGYEYFLSLVRKKPRQ